MGHQLHRVAVNIETIHKTRPIVHVQQIVDFHNERGWRKLEAGKCWGSSASKILEWGILLKGILQDSAKGDCPPA